jgi:glycosyltransferase involved in cell wall biosynthesis
VKLALVMGGGVPNPTASGGSLTTWTVLHHLLDRGHDVTVFVLRDPEHYSPTDTSEAERVRTVRELGVDVVELTSRATEYFRTLERGPLDRVRRAFRPLDEELEPTLVDAPEVRSAIEDSGIAAAFVYHWDALAATHGLALPRLGAVGDPPQLSHLYRFREELPHPRALRRVVRLQAQLRLQPRLLARLLSACELRGAFAAHHAAWLRAHGVPDCRYLHTPVPDSAGPDWQEHRDAAIAYAPPSVLLVGHLKGVVTLEGLRRFAKEILPRLDAAGVETRIAGGYDPPPDLARLLDRPSVRLLGHVEGAEAEFRRAQALLVPNAIPLGVRVRIVTAWSLGVAVVSHEANAQGIPELEHGTNALLGSSGAELAGAALLLVRDAELRRGYDASGRATYERAFAPRVAAGEIAELLECLVPARASATAG